jgi:hypothetical protein
MRAECLGPALEVGPVAMNDSVAARVGQGRIS